MKVRRASVAVAALPKPQRFSTRRVKLSEHFSHRLSSASRFLQNSRLAATAEEKVVDASEEDLKKVWRRFLINQRKEAKHSLAELSRTLIENSTKGVLSVISNKAETSGFPFSATVAYAAGDDGKPVFFMADLAPHTSGMKADGRISLMVTEKENFDGRFQKATLTGTVEEVTTNLEPLKELLLAKVPKASMYLHYTDFTWFKMTDVAGVHFITDAVSGNPTVGETSDYLAASSDPAWSFQQEICDDMNIGHDGDCMALAEATTGFPVDSARFLRVDSLGIDVDCSRDQFGTFTCRVGYASPAKDRAEVRERIAEAIERAHQATDNKYKGANN